MGEGTPPIGSSAFPIESNHCGSTQSQVVLEGDFGSFHLTLFGLSPQLPIQFCALRKPCSTQRMTLRDETSGGVHDNLASIGLGF